MELCAIPGSNSFTWAAQGVKFLERILALAGQVFLHTANYRAASLVMIDIIKTFVYILDLKTSEVGIADKITIRWDKTSPGTAVGANARHMGRCARDSRVAGDQSRDPPEIFQEAGRKPIGAPSSRIHFGELLLFLPSSSSLSIDLRPVVCFFFCHCCRCLLLSTAVIQ